MNVQRAATGLILGKYDVAAVALQDAHRRGVYVAEKKRHNAAVEHGDSGPARADGGKCDRFRLEEFLRNGRQHGVHVAEL